MTRATVKATPATNNLTAYRIEGESAESVQFEIDRIMNARDTAHATFSFPIREGRKYISVGTVLSYERAEI